MDDGVGGAAGDVDRRFRSGLEGCVDRAPESGVVDLLVVAE